MRAIYFDLDGTLLHFEKEYKEILREAIRTVNGTVSGEDISNYNKSFFELFDEQKPAPYLRAAREVTDRPKQLVNVLKHLECECTHLPQNGREDLSRISKDNRIGVLTDGVRDWQLYKLRSENIHHMFDAMVASYEAGTHKKGEEPYYLAEERIEADEYAMVGDSMEADVNGARSVEWCAYHYEGEGFFNIPDDIDW